MFLDDISLQWKSCDNEIADLKEEVKDVKTEFHGMKVQKCSRGKISRINWIRPVLPT